MIERFFGELGPAVDAVHDLQWTGHGLVRGFRWRSDRQTLRFRRILPTRLQPVAEAGSFLGKADAEQAVERERGVANPRVAVVPIPRSADRLGQATGRRRDNCAGGLE